MTDEQIEVVLELEKLGLQKASDCYGVVTMKMREEGPPQWLADVAGSEIASRVRAEIEPTGKITWSVPQ